MEHSGLWTVEQVSRALFRSEQGIRRLVKDGKLEAVRDGRKLLIKEESIHTYVEKLPHPPIFHSLLMDANQFIGSLTSRLKMMGYLGNRTLDDLNFGHDKRMSHELRVAALYKRAKEAITARKYAEAEEIRHQLWQEFTDYEMLEKTIKYPTPSQKPDKPHWAMDMLFTDEELGQA